MSISRDDWLAALEAAQAEPPTNDPAVMTISELRVLFDRGRSTTEDIVKRLVATGKAARTVKYIRVNGAWRRVPAYRLVKDGQAK